MKHELLQMRKQGSGAIVNCSSLGGLVGLAGRAAYHASKHGVIGLTKSAAMDYAQQGIRINAVCPGCIDTPMGAGIDPDAMKGFLQDQPIGRHGPCRGGRGSRALAVQSRCELRARRGPAGRRRLRRALMPAFGAASGRAETGVSS